MDIIQNFINQIKDITIKNWITYLIALFIILLFFAISKIISYIIIKIFYRKEKLDKKNSGKINDINVEKRKQEIKENAFYNPLNLFIKITGIYLACIILNLPEQYKVFIFKMYKIGIIYCVSSGIANLFDQNSFIFRKIGKNSRYKNDFKINNFVSKLIKVLIYIIAIYLIMLELGYNLGGLFTGLGISGVVIAFAAQDIAKNLFGGFAILMDKPFSIGDWIEVDSYAGTVVDITFRSTKIKAIDSTIITINNSTISDSYIKNWGNIDRRRYSISLNLPLETSEEVIRKLIKKIKFILKTNENIIKETLQVHFEKIDVEGIKIIIYLDTSKTEYNDYQDFKDEINLELMKILESEKIKLAYPGKNIFIKNNDEINKKLDNKQ